MQCMEDAWKNFMATGSVTAYLDYKYGDLDGTSMKIGKRDNQEHPDVSERGYMAVGMQGESSFVHRRSQHK